MINFIELLIPIVILLLQYFLSTRQKSWLGSLLPMTYVLIIIYIITLKQIDISFSKIMIFLLGLVTLLGVWTKGRDTLKAKQDREIQIMKTKDIRKK